MKTVTVRVPESMPDAEVKLAAAIEAYTRGSASAGRAAEIAELPLQTFIHELTRRGVTAYPYTDDEARRELE
jgi:predicted HTH domain antitoxin